MGLRGTNRSQWPDSDFNPPIPCGMGLGGHNGAVQVASISIHPSRVGWDRRNHQRKTTATIFQSTHPVWDGTPSSTSARNDNDISIHPSRVGWDQCDQRRALQSHLFQSTHPVWDGTPLLACSRSLAHISIHPSRVGWDRLCYSSARSPAHFNPPIPCGMGL